MLDLFIANEKVEFRHQNPVAFWLLNRKTFKCFLCALLTSWQMRSHCHPLFLIATIFRNHIICFTVKSLPSNQKAEHMEHRIPFRFQVYLASLCAQHVQYNRIVWRHQWYTFQSTKFVLNAVLDAECGMGLILFIWNRFLVVHSKQVHIVCVILSEFSL